jgi:antitoxin component of RelBE/YafQ-DinJ toxin-antitoxin module
VSYLAYTKIRLSHLRQIIREAVAAKLGTMPDDASRSLLSKIARTRPLPDAALKPAEKQIVTGLKDAGLVSWDLGSMGWTVTQADLDALGRW